MSSSSPVIISLISRVGVKARFEGVGKLALYAIAVSPALRRAVLSEKSASCCLFTARESFEAALMPNSDIPSTYRPAQLAPCPVCRQPASDIDCLRGSWTYQKPHDPSQYLVPSLITSLAQSAFDSRFCLVAPTRRSSPSYIYTPSNHPERPPTRPRGVFARPLREDEASR
jgi:hypothetical protein